jgi:hypothetical protein
MGALFMEKTMAEQGIDNGGSSAVEQNYQYPQEINSGANGRIISPSDFGGRSAYQPLPVGQEE